MHPAVLWSNHSAERPLQATAAPPPSRLGIRGTRLEQFPSSRAIAAPEPLRAITPMWCVKEDVHPMSSNALAPSQGSKEVPHPRPPKRKPRRKPDWRTAPLEKAHSWLLYKKVLHRGGGASHYQTMSLELPEESRNKRWPRFRPNKSFLALETRLEDDIMIPKLARVARYQRDKVLERNGGIAPPIGHKDHSKYSKFCELCKGYC
ncbi:g12676 [Coccomyxa viridis]|uniref:G12676 protein n=1 Tax=Coccomyxa viridis TaxID=1274662 RepID=A0ABP1GAZ0_9CHLO